MGSFSLSAAESLSCSLPGSSSADRFLRQESGCRGEEQHGGDAEHRQGSGETCKAVSHIVLLDLLELRVTLC